MTKVSDVQREEVTVTERGRVSAVDGGECPVCAGKGYVWIGSMPHACEGRRCYDGRLLVLPWEATDG